MKRAYPILVRVLAICFGSLVGLVFLLSVINLSLTTVEKHRYPAPGKMVEIGGHKMHVLTEGSGPRNVVLLSGWGTPSPVTDFAPLINALEPDFTVTIVECFGYGWSDSTRVPRTNHNVIEEVRAALRQAGILPPYIVVPHSISGIYTLYWTNAHPEEISAVVGLDPSVPGLLKYMHSAGPMALLQVAHIGGIVRLALLVDPALLGYNSPVFSDVQKQTLTRMAIWNYGNTALTGEGYLLVSNLREVQDCKFPSAIPTSMILSKDSVQLFGRLMPGLDWVKVHQEVVARDPKARIYLVDGGHYVHWLNSQ